MSHVVFLAGSYYPNFSAVGYCAYQVQKCLLDEFDVSVVAFRNNMALPVEEVHLGIRIQRIETNWMKRRNKLESQSGGFASTRLLALRTWGALRRLAAPQAVDWSLVQAYLDHLTSMVPRPSAIVPLVFPFETVVAALAYKNLNPDIAIIPYLFDNFAESNSLHVLKIARQLKLSRHLRLERKMLEEASAVLSMHSLREHFEANFDKFLVDKVTFIEHPLLSRPQECIQRRDDGTVRLCFTGSLLKGYVEPDYLLELLRAVRVTTPVHADFYVMGNVAHKVRTEKIGDSVHIVNHGRVSKSEADAAVRNADILVNIGEVKGKQVSSKIFEYMSTGKPIVHLAYVEDDAVSKILQKYPLALCFVQNDLYLDENARRIEKYIAENRNKALTFEDVKAIYPEALPETTGDLLGELVRRFIRKSQCNAHNNAKIVSEE